MAHDDVSVPDDLKLFCSAFWNKLLNLMDDTEQVFLWATAAMLDGRIQTTKFAQCIWSKDCRHEWPNVVREWTIPKRLNERVAREIINMVREMPMSRHCFGNCFGNALASFWYNSMGYQNILYVVTLYCLGTVLP